jgi:hypothetical protein
MAEDLARITSGGFPPYGTCSVSATYSRSLEGSAARISRKTARPPTPESNTPTIRMSRIIFPHDPDD